MAFWQIALPFAGVFLLIAYIIARQNTKHGIPFGQAFFFAILMLLGLLALVYTAFVHKQV